MNILMIGGDGFCGWPTSLELLKSNHKVIIADNLSRREIDKELGVRSITDIRTPEVRVNTAREIFDNKELYFEYLDVAKNYDGLLKLIKSYEIDTIVHFAEIKSAPYSMIDSDHMRYTVDHNMSTTNNILTAIVESKMDIHLVHLGTMGVYGYKDEFGKIPEGYLDITVNQTNQNTQILWPTDPGSIYHMTKSMDQILFQFYNKNWDIRITDLHQGIVWGVQTDLTSLHHDLVNRFDYDGIYGTVLNRFIAEAASNHPITVHGTGGQNRAFINIQDTVRCIRMSIENRPDTSRVRIFNQVAEVLCVKDLAEMLHEKTSIDIMYMENPRKERAENNLEVENVGLKSLGFEPIKLSDNLLHDVMFIADQCKDNVDHEKVIAKVQWNVV